VLSRLSLNGLESLIILSFIDWLLVDGLLDQIPLLCLLSGLEDQISLFCLLSGLEDQIPLDIRLKIGWIRIQLECNSAGSVAARAVAGCSVDVIVDVVVEVGTRSRLVRGRRCRR